MKELTITQQDAQALTSAYEQMKWEIMAEKSKGKTGPYFVAVELESGFTIFIEGIIK